MGPTMEARVEPAGEARLPLGPAVEIDEVRIRERLDEVIRSTAEEMLKRASGRGGGPLVGSRLPIARSFDIQ